MVLGRVEGGVRTALCGCLPGELGDPGGGRVQQPFVELTGLDRCPHVGRTGCARGGHFEVQACGQRPCPVDDRAPVGDHQAVVAPLAAEYVGQQPSVLRGVHAVDPVVGAHHGPRARLGHHPAEGREVDLAQGACVDVRTDRHPVGLLVVRREVLEGGADALRLQTVHPGRAQHAAEQRILGEVLEVASAQRAALDVDARAEQHVHTVCVRLVGERAADPSGQFGVPGGGQGDGGWEAGGRGAFVDAEVVGLLLGLQPQAVRAVRHAHGRDAHLRESGGVPPASAGGQRSLLAEAQPGHCRHRVGHGCSSGWVLPPGAKTVRCPVFFGKRCRPPVVGLGV